VKKLVPFLALAYAINGLLVAWFTTRLLLRVYDAQTSSGSPATSTQLFPVVVFAVVATLFVAVFAALAILLARRRARRTALFMAGISCLGIPVGTILGGLTIYALTRPENVSEFTPTA
jgi:hypothetical protein